jgi:hypothetical protein
LFCGGLIADEPAAQHSHGVPGLAQRGPQEGAQALCNTTLDCPCTLFTCVLVPIQAEDLAEARRQADEAAKRSAELQKQVRSGSLA